MRTNPVKEKLLAGKPVFGAMGWEFLVPGLPQLVMQTSRYPVRL